MAANKKRELDPIRRVPLYEQVADRLREFIDEQQLQPGDRLMSERDLAKQLGVSRSPIRQALIALRTLGLIEIRHGDGIYLLRPAAEMIASFALEVVENQADLPQIWEVRQPLEAQAARLAARRRTDSDLARLQEALDSMADAVSAGDDGFLPDKRFHAGIVQAARSPILESVIRELQPSLDRASQASLSQPGRPAISLRHHRDIYTAIETQDETAARNMMLHHLEATSEIAFVRPAD
jgi:GntR family transcriptional regulator, transcriptional repressor for pyruvate dehydrogenase complex